MLRGIRWFLDVRTFIRCTQTALQSVNDTIFLTGQVITQANDALSSTTINKICDCRKRIKVSRR